MQYGLIRKLNGEVPFYVLPLALEDLPEDSVGFDTVFSMGVLYHRRSPIDHLQRLLNCLRPGGELVLETLVVEGDENTVLMPEGRYAAMGNVWFIPSTQALERWLRRLKLINVRTVDVNVTRTEEQHSTEWMPFKSLPDFLDADNPALTREGLPAPTRAIVIANRPD